MKAETIRIVLAFVEYANQGVFVVGDGQICALPRHGGSC
jgi:hypothetical protein